MWLNVKKYYFYIIFIFTLFFLIFYISNTPNEREKYESFLRNKYAGIPNYSNKELKEIPEPGQPHMATFQNNFMTLDPELGYVPSDRLYRAFLEKKSLNSSSSTRSISWENIPSNMGGRTRTAMFDPNDPTYSKVWAAGVSGGLWFNNNIHDENSIWQPVDDFWDNLSVSKIIYDPNNTQIFYVATGEANTAITTYRESSSRGIGIWKTINGGESWELLESTYQFEYITDIGIKIRNNISELYACVVSGVYQGEEHESSPSDGLYRSLDNGNSWEQILPNIIGSNTPYSPADIEITSSGKLFIGTMKNLNGEGGATILSSNTGDYGTWTINDEYKIEIESSNNNNIPGRIILSSCKSQPEYIYAAIGAGFLNNMGFNLSYGEFIIKSSDSGFSWEEINIPTDSPNEWASLAWHALAISVHPENPNILFAAGLELYKSINGGESWVDLSEWDLMYSGGGDRYVHADIHQIIFHPDNSNIILTTTDGGIFYSNNSHLPNYEPIFIERNQGYNTLQFYTCDISSNIQNIEVVGGLQDNGTLYFNSDTSNPSLSINNMITGGDGAYCFFDNNDPILITSTYYNAWYQFNIETNQESYVNNLYNFPNPFYKSTFFTFYLSKYPADIKIEIYNIHGEKIHEIIKQCENYYNVIKWDGKNNSGIEIGNGPYIYSFNSNYNGEIYKSMHKLSKLK